MLTTANPDNGL